MSICKFLFLFVLETPPFRKNRVERHLSIEYVDTTQYLAIVNIFDRWNIYVNVKVVGHEHIRQHDDTAEIFDTAHQRNSTSTFFFSKEKRSMRKTAYQMITSSSFNQSTFSHGLNYTISRILYQ